MSDNNDLSTAPALVMQFAKWPERGRVKTRLMPALGEAGALKAHVRLTSQVLENLIATGLNVQFWWDRALPEPPQAANSILERLAVASIDQRVQQGADLGERMHRALAAALRGQGRALIIGSDCPSVDPEYVHAAVRALDHHDVVLGPSDDGGYVLIGARRLADGMLDNIAWGTGQVLAQTRDRLAGAGLSATLLEPRWDVDEPGDWERFLHTFPGS